MSEEKPSESTTESVSMLNTLVLNLGSKECLMGLACGDLGTIANDADKYEDAFKNAKRCHGALKLQSVAKQGDVSSLEIQITNEKDKFEQAVRQAEQIRDTAIIPLNYKKGAAEAALALCLKKEGATKTILDEAEALHNAVEYLLKTKGKKAFAFASVEQIRAFLGVSGCMHLVEICRDPMKNLLRVLINMDYAHNAFVVKNRLQDEVVVQKTGEKHAEIRARFAKVLGFDEEEIAFIQAQAEKFSLVRSPAPKSKKSGQGKSAASSNAVRPLSFDEETIISTTLARKKQLEEKDVALEQERAEKESLRAECEKQAAELELLRSEVSKKRAAERAENDTYDWSIDSDERGHKKARKEE